MSSILIVEDEDIIRQALVRLLTHAGHEVRDAGSVEDALKLVEEAPPQLVITDVRLPGRPGTDMIEEMRERFAHPVPVLVMTSYASMRAAVDAMKKGAVDYIAKPFDHSDMLAAVNECLSRSTTVTPPGATGQPGPTDPGFDESADSDVSDIMYGRSPEMQQVFHLIRKVAPTDSTVLILGESGTGKELAARALHGLSYRRNKPMISVNCAAIPETLIESELFGHEKGAFTGAASSRTGLIEAAEGGSLFLDEIGELPLEAQARLLRVLQESEIRRVGSTQSRKVDVRLIAATHRNLRSLARTGEFREDLFYRLNVMPIRLPPLRARGNDLIGLAEKLLQRMIEKNHLAPIRLSAAALERITAHDWPGNVRELENAIERATILADGPEISPELLGLDHEDDHYARQGLAGPNTQETAATELSLEDYFQHFVLENQENMSETELAKKLGISRKSLWERRQRLGIPRPRKDGR